MNIFVYDEHTPAQAKKQAGRESFCGFLPTGHCHHTAITNLPLTLLFNRKRNELLTSGLRKHSKQSKAEAMNLLHGHSSRKRTPGKFAKTITKKEKRHLQIKPVGCILHLGEIKKFLPKNRPDHPADASGLSPAVSEFEMMSQPNRRLARLFLSTLLL